MAARSRAAWALLLALLVGARGSRCWIRLPHGCRGDPESWPPPATVEVAAAAASLERCEAAAQRQWAACGNAALEPVEFALAELPEAADFDASYPDAGVRQELLRGQLPPYNEVYHYDIAFFWALSEFTQYSDLDVARPECGEEWGSIRSDALLLARAPDAKLCEVCQELPRRMYAASNGIDSAEFPFSGARSDCFLGVVAILASEFLCICRCTMRDPSVDMQFWNAFGAVWRLLQNYLEVLMFFLTMRLEVIAMSGWPLAGLLRRVGEALREEWDLGLPNECDLLDDDYAKGLREDLRPMVGWNGSVTEEFDGAANTLVMKSLNYVQKFPNNCPLGHATALLALVLTPMRWPQVQLPPEDFSNEALDVLKAWDYVQGLRVGAKRRFFYDLLTTEWPWLRMVEELGRPARLVRTRPPTGCSQRVLDAAASWAWHGSESPFRSHGLAPLARQAEGEALAAALCRLEGLEVLFLSGTSSGFKWGSYTVRGRQAARGLRQVRDRGPAVRSRAWNQNCEVWCERRRLNGPLWSSPAVVVHIKYPCKCAMELLASDGAHHVYDPVDQFALVPAGMDAILAQTTTAASDYANHPSVLAQGTRIFWHPLHHSNFENLEVPWRPVAAVGSHTTHNDTELYGAIEDMLHARFPDVGWLHIDPGQRFMDQGMHVVSPQQTQRVYHQLLELDVAVLRHQGCMMHLKCEVTRRWFCDRYKTGQRLANAFAVGLPTVLWHEQGFLDIVSGSGYPAVARTVKEAVGWVRRIVADDGLRADLRRRALALAAPYALPRMSERLALILADVLGRPPQVRPP